jgi:hypothetical protein
MQEKLISFKHLDDKAQGVMFKAKHMSLGAFASQSQNTKYIFAYIKSCYICNYFFSHFLTILLVIFIYIYCLFFEILGKLMQQTFEDNCTIYLL